MQQALDPHCATTILLGDRGEQRRATDARAWSVVHACAHWVAYTTAMAAKNAKGEGRKALQPAAMMQQLRAEVNTLLLALQKRAMARQEMQAFLEDWVDSGAAEHLPHEKIALVALQAKPQQHMNEQATAASAPHILAFSDGSWDPDGGSFEPGVGAVEFAMLCEDDAREEEQRARSRGESTPTLFQLGQIGLDKEQRSQSWAKLTHVHVGEVEGGDAKTNNVAELRGLQYLLRRAAKRPIGTKTKIATDSLYARNVTLGVWKFRRGQHASLIKEMRATLRNARRRHGLHGIHIDHVRSHTGMPGNELADEAAAIALERANTAPELQHALPPPPGIAWGEKALKDMGATTR
jgi:ribonuclease HI